MQESGAAAAAAVVPLNAAAAAAVSSGSFSTPTSSSRDSPSPAAPQAKSKKASFVEKINKTLDKISSPSSGSGGNSNSSKEYGQQFPAWVYPAHYNTGANAASTPPSNVRSSKLAAATAAMLYPYPGGGGSPYYDYTDLSFDYGGGIYQFRASDLSSPAAAAASLPPCTCYDRLYGSVRGQPKLCRSCRLQQDFKARYKRPALIPAAAPTPPKHYGSGGSYRGDPYEYMRKTRIGSTASGVQRVSDDWQSCWIDEEEDEKISRRSTNSTFKGGNSSGGKQPVRISSGAVTDRREISLGGASQQAGRADTIGTGFSSGGGASSGSGVGRKSILGPTLNPYELNSAGQENVGGRKDKKDQCKNKEVLGENDVGGDDSANESGDGDDENESNASRGESVTADDESTGGGKKRRKRKVKRESGDDDGDVEGPLAEEKSNGAEVGDVDQAPANKKSNRPLRKHNSGHKYFRRSRSSVQIDEVIVEEDEAALEAENFEVISRTPPIKVKSILKQPKEDEGGGDSGNKKGVKFEEKGKKMGAVASTAMDSAALSPELLLPQQPGRDPVRETVVAEKAEPKPVKPALVKSNSPTKKKSVAFADLVETKSGDVGLPFDSFSPLSLTSSSSSSSSDDEWSGYDKVIVSHNLAEEILDEIYGKLPEEAASASASGSEGGSTSDPSSSGHYEDVGATASAVANPAKETKTLKAKALATDQKQKHRKSKKSMADEILDELYGSKADVTGNANANSDSPNRSPRTAARSRDDSQLPDNAALIMGKSLFVLAVGACLTVASSRLCKVLLLSAVGGRSLGRRLRETWAGARCQMGRRQELSSL